MLHVRLGFFLIFLTLPSWAATNAEDEAFYQWLANSQVMSSDSLLSPQPTINLSYINQNRIANATPLIKFYADILSAEGVPVDFAILPFIESDNNPLAKSPKNALGLWQFIPSTGSEWGLHESFLEDERTDVQKSTRAAAKYLKFLHQKFHDWNLVLAAYNWGSASVDLALRKGLKNSKGQINLLLLPPETQAYLVSFYAFNRVIKEGWTTPMLKKYPNKPYLIQISPVALDPYLNQYPEVRPVNDWVLKYVNGFDVKTLKQSKRTILVPTPLFSRYFLLDKVTFKNKQNISVQHPCGDNNHSQYTAHYGDSLTSIALLYRMKVDRLMDLNPMVRAVRPGMVINIC